MSAERRLVSEAAFALELAARLAKGFVISQEHGEPGVYREARLHRGLDGATVVLVWDHDVRPRVSPGLVAALAALVALLFVVLGASPVYARDEKARAPIGRQSDGAHDQRGTSSMGHDDDSAPAGPAEGEELEHSLSDIREAAKSGDLARLRSAFRTLELRIVSTPEGEAAARALDVERGRAEEAWWLATNPKDPTSRALLERFANFRTAHGDRTALMGYAPRHDEGPGMLAARLAEDEARVPWSPPHEDVSEADFANGKRLVVAIVDAFVHGNAEDLSRLPAAFSALRGEDDSTYETAVRFVAFVDVEIDRWKRGEPLERTRDEALERLRRMMGEYFDPALENVEPRFLATALDEAARGVRGAVATAAEIALRTKAMSAWTADTTHDVLVSRFKKRIEEGRRRAKKSQGARD